MASGVLLVFFFLWKYPVGMNQSCIYWLLNHANTRAWKVWLSGPHKIFDTWPCSTRSWKQCQLRWVHLALAWNDQQANLAGDFSRAVYMYSSYTDCIIQFVTLGMPLFSKHTVQRKKYPSKEQLCCWNSYGKVGCHYYGFKAVEKLVDCAKVQSTSLPPAVI